MTDTTVDRAAVDLGADFLDALDELGADFLAALDAPADGDKADDGDGDDFDLVASLTEEAALGAWIKRAKARYNQVRAINRAHLVRQETKAAGRTYTPVVDGVRIGTITLKGKSREVVVDDPKTFGAWVAKHFPTEVTKTVWLGDVVDPDKFVAWLTANSPVPVEAGVTTTVRSSFQSKVLKSLNDALSTTLEWPVNEQTGEVRSMAVDGVKVVDVEPDDRVHQIKLDPKNGGEDAAAEYFRDRGLDALLPGAEDAA